MIRPPFTPSKAALVATCVGSATLEYVSWRSPGAALGTGRHKFLERVPDVGREAALAEIQDDTTRDVCAGLDLEALGDLLDRRAFVPELALAWDYETGEARELGRGKNRDYSGIRGTEIPGTADTVGLVEPDGAMVVDYKPEFGSQPSAQRHMQLRLLALMVARTFNREWVRVQIVRPSDDGAWRSSATFDMWELAAIAEQMRALAHRVLAARLAYEAGEPPPLTVGDHCNSCDSIRFCPTVHALARDGEAMVVRAENGLTDEEATRFYHATKALEALTERAMAAAKAISSRREIRVDEENVFGPVDKHVRRIVGGAGFHAVAAEFGEPAAWGVTELKITLARAEDLVRKSLEGKRGLTKAFNALLERIDRAGGLKTDVHTEYRKHRG